MSFDRDERNDPDRSWLTKEPMEVISTETEGTTDQHFEEMISLYDRESESIRNQKNSGVCSVCGHPLSQKNLVRCYYGCQSCGECASDYNGRNICRKDVEVYYGTKLDAFGLVGSVLRMNRKEMKDSAGINEDLFAIMKSSLERRGYLRQPFNSLFNGPKITPLGREALPLLVKTYKSDEDFALFLKKIGVA
ncbi:MAG: hypothetical protein MN733_28680 [Nitrososphaera sp.]|nr:hypothetical protein [Nitrososphaera sp.]